jgi:acyl carrier protein
VAHPLSASLAMMVAEATDGHVSADDVLSTEHTLSALGVTSLAVIRLIDAIEDAYGVDVDPLLVDDFQGLVSFVAGELP